MRNLSRCDLVVFYLVSIFAKNDKSVKDKDAGHFNESTTRVKAERPSSEK